MLILIFIVSPLHLINQVCNDTYEKYCPLTLSRSGSSAREINVKKYLI